jgi:hypothetical protein
MNKVLVYDTKKLKFKLVIIFLVWFEIMIIFQNET